MPFACPVGASAGPVPPTTPAEKLVQDLPLQGYFHTARAWRLKIYAGTGGFDLGRSGEAPPVRICFESSTSPHDTPSTCWSGAFQRLDSVRLSPVPGPDGRVGRRMVVIRLTGQVGPTIHGTTHGLVAWEHDRPLGFDLAVKSTVSFAGVQKFVTTGPLAGAFVSVDEVGEGDEPTAASPRHYRMSVYEPVRFGYLKVLGVISKHRYPSPLLEGIPHPIATLTPEIASDLDAVYPRGVYAHAVQR